MDKYMQTDVLPCWYDMAFKGWENEDPAIILKLRKDFIRSVKPVTKSSPVVQMYKKELSLNSMFDTWDGALGQASFGFNGAFKLRAETNEFFEYLIPVPQIHKPMSSTCPECDGTGKDQYYIKDSECHNCFGTGKNYQIDWPTADSISASLSIFSEISAYPKSETSSELPQLLTFHSGAKPYFLGGVYGIPLVKYLKYLGENTPITAMINAMIMTWQKMMGKRDYDRHRFNACVAYSNGGLNVNIPGDACGLNPSSHYIDEDGGCEFCDHNLDNPMQQITLIAGLAALYEKARQDMTANPRLYT